MRFCSTSLATSDSMPTLDTRDVSISFAQHGSRADEPVLLLHGWSCQMLHWPARFIEGLVRADFRVITMDNRDIGLSGKLDQYQPPDPTAILSGESITPPYGIVDMAADASAVLDYLGLGGAHLIGFSMGGMIAQRIAIDHPERVFSLTSMMSSTSDPGLPPAESAAAAAFFRVPEGEKSEVVAQIREGWEVIGGPHYSSCEEGLGQFAEAAFERGYSADGIKRQGMAVLAEPDRTTALASVQAQTLVIHGELDPLISIDASKATADAIAGATLATIERIGHDLPDSVVPTLVDILVWHLETARAMR